jgi:FMN phosphatase YigB (HAD superfamily)
MKAVVFDFGGTIDTDGVHWSEKFWEYYDRYGIPVTKGEFEKAFVRSETETAKDPRIVSATFRETLGLQFSLQCALMGLGENPGLVETLADECYRDVQDVVARARPVFDRLRGTYRMAVVSNFYGNLGVVLKELGLERYFQAVVDSALVGVAKPDPAIFRIALEQLAVKPGEACVVGDSYDRDIVPAKKLGCSTIWLKGRSWTTQSATAAADHTVGRFSEIEAILLAGI